MINQPTNFHFENLKKLNMQTRTEAEFKAIRLKLTLAIIEDILKCK